MPFGLLASVAVHAALLFWAIWAMHSVTELPSPDTPAISAELITPSEFLRLKKGSEDAKHLDTKAKEEPKPDDSKNDTKKPDTAPPPPPPPPPQEQAKLEEPPPPEPPKAEQPPPPPEPPKAETPPPPPEPAPGPTPEEQKLLEQKIEEARLAEEKKKAEEAKKKADEAAKKKLAEDAKKKKLAEEAKKKALDAKKKFDEKKLADLLNKLPDDATPKALVDKSPVKKGQQAAGTSQTATDTGQEAGTATGTDYGAIGARAGSAGRHDQKPIGRALAFAGGWRRHANSGGQDPLEIAGRWQPRWRTLRHQRANRRYGQRRCRSRHPRRARQSAVQASARQLCRLEGYRMGL